MQNKHSYEFKAYRALHDGVKSNPFSRESAQWPPLVSRIQVLFMFHHPMDTTGEAHYRITGGGGGSGHLRLAEGAVATCALHRDKAETAATHTSRL